jgi:predicted MPP superfamily phosphohydrolase
LARVEAIVASANAAKADLVLLGGDYLAHVLGRRRVDPGAIAVRLGALEARLGVFGVMGNHDGRGGDTAAMRAALDAAGIAVLDDEAHHLRMARSGLWLVGLGGKRRDHAAIARVFAEVPVGIEGTDPVLVLAHDPAAFASIPRGVAAILAGHTHGGQVRLPFAGPVVNSSRAPLRHSRGRVEENGKLMYVTAGLGTSVLPIRFNCPPEMAILTIRTKPLQD